MADQAHCWAIPQNCCATDLYSTAVAQEDIMHGEEEEGLAPLDGFLVADVDPQLMPRKLEQVVDALDLIPLHVRQKVELEVSNALAEGLPAVLSYFTLTEAREANLEKLWLAGAGMTMDDSLKFATSPAVARSQIQCCSALVVDHCTLV